MGWEPPANNGYQIRTPALLHRHHPPPQHQWTFHLYMQIMHTRTGTGTGDYAAASLIFELCDVVQTEILLLSLLR